MEDRRTRRVLVRRLAGVLAVLTLLAAPTACSDDTTLAPPSASGSPAGGGERDRAALTTLAALQEAVVAGDEPAAGALATAAARPVVEAMAGNVTALGLREVGLRLVDTDGTLEPDEQRRLGDEAWPATVELTYRLPGWDSQPTRLETRVVLVPSDGDHLVAGLGGGDSRTPLWLTGPMTLREAGRALVLARGSAERYLPLVRRAVADVAGVLPSWRGRLVLEVPESQEQLHGVLAAPDGQYANIAAVTASVDGSLVPGSPVHVFVNPEVFRGLGPRGAQVVVSHEAAHVATDATFAQVPVWLSEGFADYVALADAGIPVATAAGQILARVRREGAPDRLPTEADLDPTASGLGATYEEAWLAARFIAQEYGERRLVAFYRRVSDGADLAGSFRQVLGTTEQAFVTRWAADLSDLAARTPPRDTDAAVAR